MTPTLGPGTDVRLRNSLGEGRREEHPPRKAAAREEAWVGRGTGVGPAAPRTQCWAGSAGMFCWGCGSTCPGRS